MRFQPVLVALLFAACAPPAPTSPPFASGTRLRVVAWDGGDGALSFVTFHDMELDIDCAFTLADDGVMRCMPAAGSFVFHDASCSGARFHTPFGLGCTAEPAPRYVSEPRWPSSGCSASTSTGYRLAAALPEQMTWADDGSSCSA